MIRRRVILRPGALADLDSMFGRIAIATSVDVAERYLGRVQAFLADLAWASERGTLHDVRGGVRTVGFERRLTIPFAVTASEVHALRVFQAGADWTDAL